jgi:hypothetical protein
MERCCGLGNKPGGQISRLSSAGFVSGAIYFLAAPMKKQSIFAANRSCRPLQITPASSRQMTRKRNLRPSVGPGIARADPLVAAGVALVDLGAQARM